MVDAFTEHAVELLSPLGELRARSMFGGTSIYCDGLVFAITVDGALYLKVDETTKRDFEARGLGPFTYESRGKTYEMGYHLAPDEVLEDPEIAVTWGRAAVAVAQRAAARKKPSAGKRASTKPKREP